MALSEEHGGADGTVSDLVAMLDEAAAALVPGPVVTTALGTLVLGDTHAELLEQLATGQRTAAFTLAAELAYGDGRFRGRAFVLGADSAGVLLVPAGDTWLLVDGAAQG